MRDNDNIWPKRPPAATSSAPPAAVARRKDEMRIYGRNACLAMFAHRPEGLRKVYLREARLTEFKAVIAWCVAHRLGYRLVENADLDKLTQTQHHEGVCFEVLSPPALTLPALLQSVQTYKSALLVWLDGVGNPHNVGAILRSAANFGVHGLILPHTSGALPGAALRVAEGGAEAVTVAQLQLGEDVFVALHEAGFRVAATVPRSGKSMYQVKLPERLVIALGAEGEGLPAALIERADLHLTIPGTGAVESLNVAASAAVLFGEYFRQHNAEILKKNYKK